MARNESAKTACFYDENFRILRRSLLHSKDLAPNLPGGGETTRPDVRPLWKKDIKPVAGRILCPLHRMVHGDIVSTTAYKKDCRMTSRHWSGRKTSNAWIKHKNHLTASGTAINQHTKSNGETPATTTIQLEERPATPKPSVRELKQSMNDLKQISSRNLCSRGGGVMSRDDREP